MSSSAADQPKNNNVSGGATGEDEDILATAARERKNMKRDQRAYLAKMNAGQHPLHALPKTPFRTKVRAWFFPQQHTEWLLSQDLPLPEKVHPLGNWFEHLSFLAILVNVVVLALYNPFDRTNNTQRFRDYLIAEGCLTFFFLLELVIRFVGQGFRYYVKDILRSVDACTILVAVTAILCEFGGVPNRFYGLTIIRTLRLFRPLQLLEDRPSLAILLNTLQRIAHRMMDVTVLFLLFLLLFSVAGVPQFAGRLRTRCINNVYYNETLRQEVEVNYNEYLSRGVISSDAKALERKWDDKGNSNVDDLENDEEGNNEAPSTTATIVGTKYKLQVPKALFTDWSRHEFSMKDYVCTETFDTIVLPGLLERANLPNATSQEKRLSWHFVDPSSNYTTSQLGCSSIQTCDNTNSRWLHGFECPFGYTCDEFENPFSGFLSFDNFGMAMLVMYVSTTMQVWYEVSYFAADATANIGVWYMNSYVVVAGIFIMNIVLVLIAVEFEKEKRTQREHAKERQLMGKRAQNHFQSLVRELVERRRQQSHAEMLLMTKEKIESLPTRILEGLKSFDPVPPPLREKRDTLQTFLQEKVVSQRWFLYVVTAIIASNMLVLCFARYGLSEETMDIIRAINLAFSVLFGIELLIRFMAVKTWDFITSPMQMFDAAVIALCFVDFFIVDWDFRFIRLFRLSRVAYVMQVFPNIYHWMVYIWMCLVGAPIVIALLFVVIVVFGIMCMHLFGGTFCGLASPTSSLVDQTNPHCLDNPRANFDTFSNAIIAAFQILTADDWNFIMYDAMNARGSFFAVFFCIYFYIGNTIILSLLIGTMLSIHDDEEAAALVFSSEEEKKRAEEEQKKQQLREKAEAAEAEKQRGEEGRADYEREKRKAAREAQAKRRRDMDGLQEHLLQAIEEEAEEERKIKELKQRREDAMMAVLGGGNNRDEADGASKNRKPGGVISAEELDELEDSELFAQKQREAQRRQLMEECIPKQIRILEEHLHEDKVYLQNLEKDLKAKRQKSKGFRDEMGAKKSLRERIVDAKERMQRKVRPFVVNVYVDFTFALVLILFSVSFAFEDQFVPPESTNWKVTRTIALVCHVIFFIEMILQIMAHGFITTPVSYLRRSWWNVFDFLLTVHGLAISIAVFVIASNNVGFRLARSVLALRPCSIFRRSPQMTIVVDALGNALFILRYILVAIVIFFMFFALMGVQILAGKMRFCRGPERATTFTVFENSFSDGLPSHTQTLTMSLESPIGIPNNSWAQRNVSTYVPVTLLYKSLNRTQCEEFGGEWANGDLNFDNLWDATLALYLVSSLEQWVEMLYRAMDFNGHGQAPLTNGYQYAAVYFIVFAAFGGLFVTALFTTVLVDAYNKAVRSRKARVSLLVTREVNGWLLTNRRIQRCLPGHRNKRGGDFINGDDDDDDENDEHGKAAHHEEEQDGIIAGTLLAGKDMAANAVKQYKTRVEIFRLKLRRFVRSETFMQISMFFIFANFVFSACEHYPESEGMSDALIFADYFFTAIFLIEVIVKCSAERVSIFFASQWNRLDTFVAVLSLILVCTQSYFRARLSASVRCIRILRIGRLLRDHSTLSRLMQQFGHALMSLGPVCGVVLIFLFSASTWAVKLFGRVVQGPFTLHSINHNINFSSISNAMNVLLRLSTGGDWLPLYRAVRADAEGCADRTGDCGPPKPIPQAFFLIFMIFFIHVMRNLLIAVMLDKFSAAASSRGMTKQDALRFYYSWLEFDTKQHMAISSWHILKLIRSIPVHSPLGFNDKPAELRIQLELRFLTMLKIKDPMKERVKFRAVVDLLCRFAYRVQPPLARFFKFEFEKPRSTKTRSRKGFIDIDDGKDLYTGRSSSSSFVKHVRKRGASFNRHVRSGSVFARFGESFGVSFANKSMASNASSSTTAHNNDETPTGTPKQHPARPSVVQFQTTEECEDLSNLSMTTINNSSLVSKPLSDDSSATNRGKAAQPQSLEQEEWELYRRSAAMIMINAALVEKREHREEVETEKLTRSRRGSMFVFVHDGRDEDGEEGGNKVGVLDEEEAIATKLPTVAERAMKDIPSNSDDDEGLDIEEDSLELFADVHLHDLEQQPAPIVLDDDDDDSLDDLRVQASLPINLSDDDEDEEMVTIQPTARAAAPDSNGVGAAPVRLPEVMFAGDSDEDGGDELDALMMPDAAGDTGRGSPALSASSSTNTIPTSCVDRTQQKASSRGRGTLTSPPPPASASRRQPPTTFAPPAPSPSRQRKEELVRQKQPQREQLDVSSSPDDLHGSGGTKQRGVVIHDTDITIEDEDI